MSNSENLAQEAMTSPEALKKRESGVVEHRIDSVEQAQGQVEGMAASAKAEAMGYLASDAPELSALGQKTEQAVDSAESKARERVDNVVDLEEVRTLREQARASLRLGETAEELPEDTVRESTVPESGVRKTLREVYQPEGSLGEEFEAELERVFESRTSDVGRSEVEVKEEGEKVEERASVGGVKRRLQEGDMLGAMEMSDLIDSEFGRSLAYRDVANALIDKGDLDAAKEMVSRISDERSRFGLENQLAQLQREKKTRQDARKSKEALDMSEVDEGWGTESRMSDVGKSDVERTAYQVPGTESEVGPGGTVRIAPEVGSSSDRLGPRGTLRIEQPAVQTPESKGETIKIADEDATLRNEVGPTGTLRLESQEKGGGTLRMEKTGFEAEKQALEVKREAIRALQSFEWSEVYEGSGMTKEEWAHLNDSDKRDFQGLQFEAVGYLARIMDLREDLKKVEIAMHKDRMQGLRPLKAMKEKRLDILGEIVDVEQRQIANNKKMERLKKNKEHHRSDTQDMAMAAAAAGAAAVVGGAVAMNAFHQAPEQLKSTTESEKEQLEKKIEDVRALGSSEWGSVYEGSGMTQDEWSLLDETEKMAFQRHQLDKVNYAARLLMINEGLRVLERTLHKEYIATGGEGEKYESLAKQKEEMLRQKKSIESLQEKSENGFKALKSEAEKRKPKTPEAPVAAVAAAAAVEAPQQEVAQQQYAQPAQQVEQNVYRPPQPPFSAKADKAVRRAGAGSFTGGMAMAGIAIGGALEFGKGVGKIIKSLPNFLFTKDLGDGLVNMFTKAQEKLMSWVDAGFSNKK